MSSRTGFKGKCGFCNATVNLLRRECQKCGKPVHCQSTTVASERGGSWASTSWTCQRRARHLRADGLYVCTIHNNPIP
jgi:hypothetical protein